MSLPLHQNSPILPSQDDVLLAREASRKLAPYVQSNESIKLALRQQDTQEIEIELSYSMVRLLLDVLEQMANGHAVTLMPIHAELSTQQAADLLNVSRPFLIKKLDEGIIPYRKVGSHRRVKFEDLMVYKRETYVQRSQALDELTADAQALKWGYDE